MRHYKSRLPQLKWMIVSDCRKAMAVTTKKAIRSGEPVKIDKLEEKKRGRPSLVSDKVTTIIRHHLTVRC